MCTTSTALKQMLGTALQIEYHHTTDWCRFKKKGSTTKPPFVFLEMPVTEFIRFLHHWVSTQEVTQMFHSEFSFETLKFIDYDNATTK